MVGIRREKLDLGLRNKLSSPKKRSSQHVDRASPASDTSCFDSAGVLILITLTVPLLIKSRMDVCGRGEGQRTSISEKRLRSPFFAPLCIFLSWGPCRCLLTASRELLRTEEPHPRSENAHVYQLTLPIFLEYFVLPCYAPSHHHLLC